MYRRGFISGKKVDPGDGTRPLRLKGDAKGFVDGRNLLLDEDVAWRDGLGGVEDACVTVFPVRTRPAPTHP